MFFRKKKEPQEPHKEPPPPPPPSVTPPAASEAAGAPPAAQGSTQFLTGDQLTDRRTVQVLLEAISRVSGSRDLNELLVDIVDRSIEITGAERGLLLLAKPGAAGELEVRIARSKGGKAFAGELRFSTSVARKVHDQRQPVRATVQSESEALELGQSVFDLKLRAVMCVPLAPPEGVGSTSKAAVDQVRGVLYVDSRAATRQFSQRDLGLFAALAQHISIALENARLHLDSIEKLKLEQSLLLASAIQRDLMPPVPANVPGYELCALFKPAEKTTGDFYDVIQLKDGRVAVVVGDVTGHGIGPALITASAQASLRSYLKLVGRAGEVVSLLNQDLCERVTDGRFVTMFLGLLDRQGGLEALNAGHSLPMLWRKASGAVEFLSKGGPALGFMAEHEYQESDRVALQDGDVLLLYSDGLIEARAPGSPEGADALLLGEAGAATALAQAALSGVGVQAITAAIAQRALDFAGGACDDDLTLLVVRRKL